MFSLTDRERVLIPLDAIAYRVFKFLKIISIKVLRPFLNRFPIMKIYFKI